MAIVGGSKIAISQAPWQVAVVGLVPVERFGMKTVEPFLCGGAILSAEEILTDAECLYNFNTEPATPLTPEQVLVAAGQETFKATEATEKTEKGLKVAHIRVHPYFNPEPPIEEANQANPDDVAVLELEKPLSLGTNMEAIGLVPGGALLEEGTAGSLAGYGLEQIEQEEPDGTLNSIGVTLAFPRGCGGKNNAVFLCGSSASGAACFGDFGGGLALSPTSLAGVMETFSGLNPCAAGDPIGFANLAAPEIGDFVSNPKTVLAPPRAPRGGGAVIRAVPRVGHLVTCEPGIWSEGPSITISFIDSSSGLLLQRGPSQTYLLAPTDVGRTILCEVRATNEGGTGFGRTPALPAIQAAAASGVPATPIAAPAAPVVAGEPRGVTLAASKLRALANGVVALRLSCGNHNRCTGTLTLLAKAKPKHRKHARVVTLGTAHYTIVGETTKAIGLRLSAAGRHLLESHHGHLQVTLKIVQEEPTSSTERVGAQLSLAKKKGH